MLRPTSFAPPRPHPNRALLVSVAAVVTLGVAVVPGCASDGAGLPEGDNLGDDASSELDDAGAAMDGGPGEDDASDDARADEDATPPPDVDQIPWATGADIGAGVAFKDTGNLSGTSVFVGYAGYNISLASAEAWVTALYRATLQGRGARYLWAVQGPLDPTYSQKEIGNSKIVAKLLPLVNAQTKFVLVAGHSSGSFVAHELLGQLQGGLDPQGVTDGRVVYFDLDGGSSGLSAAIVNRLRRAYFVAAHDVAHGTYSPNASTMQSLGATYAAAGGYFEHDASASGCNAGATWCVHVTLVVTKPHNPADADPAHDYSDFVGRPVCQTFLDAKAVEAGL